MLVGANNKEAEENRIFWEHIEAIEARVRSRLAKARASITCWHCQQPVHKDDHTHDCPDYNS